MTVTNRSDRQSHCDYSESSAPRDAHHVAANV